MATRRHTQKAPAKPNIGLGGFLRRRVIVELHPEELPLLEAAEERHGSKRAAFVRALEAEATLDTIAEDLAAARAKLAQLEADLGKEREARAKEEQARKRSTDDLAAARRKAKQGDARKSSAEGDARELRKQLQDLHAELAERDQEIAELEAVAFSHLFCARCGRWAPEKAWALTEGEGGEYAYHRPCGDHGKGLLEGSSKLAWRSA